MKTCATKERFGFFRYHFFNAIDNHSRLVLTLRHRPLLYVTFGVSSWHSCEALRDFGI